jgi:alkanesulfonate monooxygenase SsuD/methylene tetrahydromethanopterin reductase-like flavin-dependent oxidoreductase (luciferase family)
MRLSLFYQIQVPKPWTPSSEAQRIHEALEQIPYAEEQGFAGVWFSEHHFRPVWSHNSAPDLTLAAVSQRTSRIRLGVGVVLAPIHHPLHTAARMATLDILSHGRVDVGLGRTGYPYQLTPYGTDLRDTRGMWLEFAELLPRIWTQEEITYDGTYYHIPRREVLPKPVQRPHPPLWSACGSDETARLTGSLGMGGLFGSEGGPDRVRELMAIYCDALRTAPSNGAAPRRADARRSARARYDVLRRHTGRLHPVSRTLRGYGYRRGDFIVRRRAGAASRSAPYHPPLWRRGHPAFPDQRVMCSAGASIGVMLRPMRVSRFRRPPTPLGLL